MNCWYCDKDCYYLGQGICKYGWVSIWKCNEHGKFWVNSDYWSRGVYH